MGRVLPDRRSSIVLRSFIIGSASRPLDADTRQQLELIVDTLHEHKAVDVVTLDLRSVSDAADVFVIASGSSDTHVRALAQYVLEALAKSGERPHHVEGIERGRWALIDMVDCVVHVFHPELREYYQLERLWADAPPVSVDSMR